MNFKTFSVIVVLLMTLTTACRKKSDLAPDTSLTAYTPGFIIPYDTTGVAAIFSTHIFIDSLSGTDPGRLLYEVWGRSLSDSTSINANGTELARSAQVFQSAIKQHTVETSEDFKVSWLLKGNHNFNVIYANTDLFPICNLTFADTIRSGTNSSFSFTTTTAPNMDTALVEIFSPDKDGKITRLTYYANYKTARVAPNSIVLQALAKKNVRVNINVFNHRYLMVNGYRILFVKQFTISDYIWFK